jgi:hypothetical protein
MSQSSTPDRPSENEVPAAKGPYHPPELRTMGSMTALTRATSTAGASVDAEYNTSAS